MTFDVCTEEYAFVTCHVTHHVQGVQKELPDMACSHTPLWAAWVDNHGLV